MERLSLGVIPSEIRTGTKAYSRFDRFFGLECRLYTHLKLTVAGKSWTERLTSQPLGVFGPQKTAELGATVDPVVIDKYDFESAAQDLCQKAQVASCSIETMSLVFSVRIYLHLERDPVLVSAEVPFNQLFQMETFTVQNPSSKDPSVIDDMAVDVQLSH